MRTIATTFTAAIVGAFLAALYLLAVGNVPTTTNVAPAATQTAVTAVQAANVDTGADARTYGDEGVKLSDDTDVNAGVCRTFVGEITVFMCVPLYSPTGGILAGKVQEDGSASYSDGWIIDSESRQFYRADSGDWYGANY